MSGVDPQTVLNLLREQCTDLAAKVNSLDLDKTEHQLVIDVLQPLPAERKCFRMIGNVVVERTVEEVLPAVVKNRDQVRRPSACQRRVRRLPTNVLSHDDPTPTLSRPQINATMDKMKETLAAKQKEAEAFAAKHKIQAQGSSGAAPSKPDDDDGGSQGVLI